jgi:hypothetical protein
MTESMESKETGDSMGDGDSAPSQWNQTPGAGTTASAPSPAASTSSSQTRVRYMPQFSAATEMILKRIRGEPANVNSAISSASATGAIKQSTYEDTKRRLMSSMNTSLTLAMPGTSAPVSVRTDHTIPVAAEGRQKSGTNSTPNRITRGGKRGGRPAQGTKRKRGGDSDASDLSEVSGSLDATYKETPVPTTTKSGRQVSKPVQYNPSITSSSGKRKHYGKRTPEQALCKVCTRGLSPKTNQIVFCDGCNICWHQRCHDPVIDNVFVSDEARSWFCRTCSAKKAKHVTKKKSVDRSQSASWAAKSASQVSSITV